MGWKTPRIRSCCAKVGRSTASVRAVFGVGRALRRPVRTPQATQDRPDSKTTVACHPSWSCGRSISCSMRPLDQRRLKLANIVDEYTREALAIRVDRTCTAEDLVAVIEDLVPHSRRTGVSSGR